MAALTLALPVIEEIDGFLDEHNRTIVGELREGRLEPSFLLGKPKLFESPMLEKSDPIPPLFLIGVPRGPPARYGRFEACTIPNTRP